MAMTRVLMKTLLGDMTLELDADKAPATVANFVEYARSGHYDGTIFHRVINNFMVQGGGFDTDMRQKGTNAPIQNEANNGLKNDRGTIAMARTMDPHSATAQFFINVSDNDFLNFSGENMQGWGYAVFGRVVEGEDVLDKIRVVPTSSQAGHQDVPTDPIVIESVTVLSD
ncbi:MAG: peptidylprolyl isomerase [Pseudomonadota bacterium]|nr:peptidylprolyl isomerase [Pseudomonadota bacterium]